MDTCYVQADEAGCRWAPQQEECDGNTASCTSLGYLGAGSATCPHCAFDFSACEACQITATVLECRPITETPYTLSVTTTTNGPELLALDSQSLLFSRNGSGLVPITSVTLGLDTVVAIPNGWMTSGTDGGLSTLDATGTLGPIGAGTVDPAPSDRVLAYGAGGRVLQAWTFLDQQSFVTKIRIADTSANIVVPARPISTAGAQTLLATSDGTSFFVMTAGTLTRIGSDGSILSTTPGYPIVQWGAAHFLAWGTTGGWFVGSRNNAQSFEAQRFAATGAKVGASITLSMGIASFSVDGDDLLAATSSGTPAQVVLARITPAGTITMSPEVGVANPGAQARVARFGPDLVVSWHGANRGQLARVAF